MNLFRLILMNPCLAVVYISYLHRRDKTEWMVENIKRLIIFKWMKYLRFDVCSHISFTDVLLLSHVTCCLKIFFPPQKVEASETYLNLLLCPCSFLFLFSCIFLVRFIFFNTIAYINITETRHIYRWPCMWHFSSRWKSNRAIGQAASRPPITTEPGFSPRPAHVRFVVDKIVVE